MSSISLLKSDSPDNQRKNESTLSDWSLDDLSFSNASNRKYSVNEMEHILEGQRREVAEFPEEATPEALASIVEMEEEVNNSFFADKILY